MRKHTLPLIALVSIFGLAACGNQASTEKTSTETAITTVSENVIASGTFSGRSEHITTGKATIVGTAGNYQLVFADDFTLDGAPDPVIGFGKDGTYNAATKIGSLKNKKGAQIYSLPASFNLEDAKEVYVWCEKFSVPLGIASF